MTDIGTTRSFHGAIKEAGWPASLLAAYVEGLRAEGCAAALATGRRGAARGKPVDSGAAAERFARMVAALGGPTDLLERPQAHLAAAPVVVPVPAVGAGVLGTVDTRAIGLAVVQLGGGRRKPGDPIDWRVGLSGFAAPGQRLAAGEAIAWVHAADAASAARAVSQVLAACSVADSDADTPANRNATSATGVLDRVVNGMVG